MSIPKLLGKKPPKLDARTFKLERYLETANIPKPPDAVDFGAKCLPWPMFKNDTVGDCTCASAGHLVKAWTTYAGNPFTATDRQVLNMYSAISGYDQRTGANDDGAYMLDVLRYWRRTGLADHRITAYMQFKLVGWNLKHTIWLFGGAYLGLNLPLTAIEQIGKYWGVPEGGPVGNGAPGTWGGHAVAATQYDKSGVTIVTWGTTQRVTWEFLKVYCDEAYAILSPDWVSSGKVSPSQFNYQTLLNDLRLLG